MRRTLRVACACVSGFMLRLSLHMYYGELRIDFIFQASLACIVNRLIIVESKLRKVNLRYYKASGIYIAKNITFEK